MIAEDGEALRLSKVRPKNNAELVQTVEVNCSSQAAVRIVLKEEDGGSLAYKPHFSHQASTSTAPQLYQVRPRLELSSSVTWRDAGASRLQGALQISNSTLLSLQRVGSAWP